MTHQKDYNLSSNLTDELIKNGLSGVPELIKIMVDNAILEERNRYLEADEYERTPTRTGYANGYKPKTVNTRVGKITFSFPRLEMLRFERALILALAEIYVVGVSTRKVNAITEQSCGIEMSDMQASRATRNWMPSYKNGVSDLLEK